MSFMPLELQNLLRLLKDASITGLAADSREVAPGNAFFALSLNPEIIQHVQQAFERGAKIIFCDAETEIFFAANQINKNNKNIIFIPELRQNAGKIAADYLHHPSRAMKVIGVTGTNGKTSCAYFIAKALKQAGKSTALIGTLGNGMVDQITESALTTPDAISLQNLLGHFRDQKVEVVAMEASSQGLDQYRTAGTEFFLGIFTNLTRDHLDYHPSMTHYANAKFKLFMHPELQYAVFNLDDDYGYLWANALANTDTDKNKLNILGVSIASMENLENLENLESRSNMGKNKNAHKNASKNIHQNILPISATHIHPSAEGMTASIATPWGEGVLETHLMGRFNLANLLCVVAALGALHLPLAEILEIIKTLPAVPGRLQKANCLKQPHEPLVIIDYAHTPDALKKALQAVREHCPQGDIWCIFGCGGNRDHGKRVQMGDMAAEHADYIILTDDNPRQENPADIIADILKSQKLQEKKNQSRMTIEHHRARAIAHALQCAKPEDIILIAGKGHENYQIIGTDKQPFSDLLETRRQLLLLQA